MPMSMRRIAFSFLWVPIVVAVFGGLNGFLSATYWIPPYYSSASAFRFYLFLMIGTLCSALVGGCVGYRVPATGKLSLKIWLGICYACVATVVVIYMYMLIVVNIRGE